MILTPQARLVAGHVTMEFGARADSDAAQVDDIGSTIACAASLSVPAITETLHSWGNATSTFTTNGGNGGNGGALWGSDSSTRPHRRHLHRTPRADHH
ncbi:hypothetical protein [Actinacidiphila sp. ITFR-21]|uniref:hypothetical protein n=1 Tax=Actinacidiphila sp. ITFR-21 TaxID=3075199 RepID=UPI002889E3B7|nr:hypothetical protein [Streptomyces sp. ITFR-21]WNI16832.1 hypothetical protein RLT57_15775 [Streptomyces sp. ITFR-21]